MQMLKIQLLRFINYLILFKVSHRYQQKDIESTHSNPDIIIPTAIPSSDSDAIYVESTTTTPTPTAASSRFKPRV